MQHFTGFNAMFMEKIGFPEEARACFAAVLKRLDDEPENGFVFDEIHHDYLYPTAHELNTALERLTALAETMGVDPYTMHMTFLVSCAEVTLLRYRERGIDEGIFWDTMDDFRCKLLECKECKDVWGTFVAGWNSGFFELNRFALGRFQFEYSDFGHDDVTLKDGTVLKKGDRVITSGGINGKVHEINDNTIVIDIANQVYITVEKNFIQPYVDPQAKDERK